MKVPNIKSYKTDKNLNLTDFIKKLDEGQARIELFRSRLIRNNLYDLLNLFEDMSDGKEKYYCVPSDCFNDNEMDYHDFQNLYFNLLIKKLEEFKDKNTMIEIKKPNYYPSYLSFKYIFENGNSFTYLKLNPYSKEYYIGFDYDQIKNSLEEQIEMFNQQIINTREHILSLYELKDNPKAYNKMIDKLKVKFKTKSYKHHENLINKKINSYFDLIENNEELISNKKELLKTFKKNSFKIHRLIRYWSNIFDNVGYEKIYENNSLYNYSDWR